MTNSRLLAAFFCNCRLASSPAVLYIYIYISGDSVSMNFGGSAGSAILSNILRSNNNRLWNVKLK